MARQRMHLRLILHTADTQPAALAVALSTYLWGVWILNPFTSPFAISPTYSVFRQIGHLLGVDPELFWGVLIAGLGGLHLYGVVAGIHWLRRWGAFSTFLLRSGLLIATGLATNFTNAGIPDYACWAGASLWIYWRLSVKEPVTSER